MADSPTITPVKPRVSLSGFAEYLGATTGERLTCVQQQIRNYESEYRPGSDFYKDLVDALIRARQGSGTDAVVLEHCIDDQRQDSRRKHYRALADGWLALPELRQPWAPVGRAKWNVTGLTVGIAPEFGLQQPDGSTLVVKLWLKQQPLTKDGVRAMHWLLQRHMDQIRPGGRAVVVDLRQRQILKPTRRQARRGYDTLLTSEAEAMGSLWRRLSSASV